MRLSPEQCLLQRVTVEWEETRGKWGLVQQGMVGRFIPEGFATGTRTSSLVMRKMCWKQRDQL